MADGLVAGSCCVDVGRFVGAEDGERGIGETLGGEVDVFAAEGGRGYEEDALAEGPVVEVWGDRRVEFRHGVVDEDGDPSDIRTILRSEMSIDGRE